MPRRGLIALAGDRWRRLETITHYPETIPHLNAAHCTRRWLPALRGVHNVPAVVDNARAVVDDAVVAAYAYELRQGDEVISTGRLTTEEDVALGDPVSVAGVLAFVKDMIWSDGEPRLLLKL